MLAVDSQPLIYLSNRNEYEYNFDWREMKRTKAMMTGLCYALS